MIFLISRNNRTFFFIVLPQKLKLFRKFFIVREHIDAFCLILLQKYLYIFHVYIRAFCPFLLQKDYCKDFAHIEVFSSFFASLSSFPLKSFLYWFPVFVFFFFRKILIVFSGFCLEHFFDFLIIFCCHFLYIKKLKKIF